MDCVQSYYDSDQVVIGFWGIDQVVIRRFAVTDFWDIDQVVGQKSAPDVRCLSVL
jgi:hypothetical protein